METLLRRWQTIAPHCNGTLRLSGSNAPCSVLDEKGSNMVLSPYFQYADLREEAPGRNITISTTKMITVFVESYGNGSFVKGQIVDSNGTYSQTFGSAVTMNAGDNDATVQVNALIAAAAAITALGVPTPDSWTILGQGPTVTANQIATALAAVMPASSYQAIVTQTGTSAPTVVGGVNNYPSGTTFTWARTSAGVYTLTASAAVFTSKTSVVLGSLNNLNSSYKAVVTSSTVITITTAIGSLLGLGLLGLTATNTDALLTATQVTVQTYT